MKNVRAILFAAVLAAFCATGAARAADESPSVQVAQAQVPARSGDSLPATLGDLRHTEARINERANAMEARINEQASAVEVRISERASAAEMRMEARMDRLEDSLRMEMIEIRETIRWLILVLVAVMGLPHLASFWDRRRGNGKGGLSSAVSVLLASAPFLLGIFAIAAAMRSERNKSIRAAPLGLRPRLKAA